MKCSKKVFVWVLCVLMISNLALPVFAEGEVCLHSDTRQERGALIETTFTADAEGHVPINRYEVRVICNSCQETVSQTEETVEDPKAPHQYNSEGVCEVCSWPCPHINRAVSETRVYEDGPSRYEQKDDKTHIKYEIYDVHVNCIDCGKEDIVPVERVEKTLESPHRFFDGQCANCGYVSHCTHANTEHREEEDVSYTYVTFLNSDEHTIHRKLDDIIYCLDCGQRLSRASSRYTTEVEAHEFTAGNVDGIQQPEKCHRCGYQKACEHPSTEIKEEEGDTTILGGDANGCTLHGNMFYHEICTVCKAVLSTRVEENYVRQEPHQLVNGKCSLCGYDTSCQHPQTRKEYFFDVLGGYPTLISIDSEGHTYSGSLFENDVCVECGSVVHTEFKKDVPHKDPHNYSGDVCLTCGYKKGSMTPAPTVEPTAAPSVPVPEIINLKLDKSTVAVGETITATWEVVNMPENGRVKATWINYTGSTGGDDSSVFATNTASYTPTRGDQGQLYLALFDGEDNFVQGEESKPFTITGAEEVNPVPPLPANARIDGQLDKTTVAVGQPITGNFELVNGADGWVVVAIWFVEENGESYSVKGEQGKTTSTYTAQFGTEGTLYLEAYHPNMIGPSGDLSMELPFTITNAEPAEKLTLTLNKSTRTVAVGSPITATWSAKGGTAPYSYYFGWSLYQDQQHLDYAETENSTETTSTYIPAGGNVGGFGVTVIDAKGRTDHQSFDFEVVKAAPTAPPEPEYHYEVTPRPNPVTPRPSEAPAAPTPAPVVNLVQVEKKPLAEALEDMGGQIEALQQDAAKQVVVNIVNLEKIATQQEMEALRALSITDQMLVLVSAMGYGSEVAAAQLAGSVHISSEANALIASMAQRIQTMSQDERAAFEQVLKESFAVERVQKDGVWQEYFVIELMVTVDGVSRVERYGFRFDGKAWEFTLLENQPAA